MTAANRPRPGDRVFVVVQITDDNVAEVLGPGVYEGDFLPDESIAAVKWIRDMGYDNPRIRLDSGEVVYGVEVWWGEEQSLRAQIDGYKVKTITVEQMRSRLKEEGK